MKYAFRYALAVALLATGTANAAITSVTASPTTAHTALTSATSLPVGWSAATDVGGSVWSAQGVFRTATGEALGTINQPLNQTVSGAGTAVFSETIVVPVEVVNRAHQLGLSSLRYERRFKDSGLAATGAVVLRITSAPAAGFGISRVTLTFDDNKALTIVNRGAKLTARAEVAATGAGILKGVWEVAGPNPETAKPPYLILGAVHQALTGRDPTILTSPALPTGAVGTYRLRLRLSEPASGFEMPVVHYFVSEKRN
jgi:hypothetical protein